MSMRTSTWNAGALFASLLAIALAGGCGDGGNAKDGGGAADGGGAKADGKPGSSSISAAVKAGDLTELRRLLGAGENVDPGDLSTVLMLAIDAQRADAMEMLLSRGAKPTTTDESGRPALLRCAEIGFAAGVAALLARDVDVNARDRQGMTALHLAVANNHAEVVDRLIAAGADINAADSTGLTPLHAGLAADTAVLDKLSRKGAQIHTTNVYGSTPLHTAAASANVTAVKWLLDQGADPTIKNENGFTPLDLARKDSEAAEVLRAAMSGEKPSARADHAEIPDAPFPPKDGRFAVGISEKELPAGVRDLVRKRWPDADLTAPGSVFKIVEDDKVVFFQFRFIDRNGTHWSFGVHPTGEVFAVASW